MPKIFGINFGSEPVQHPLDIAISRHLNTIANLADESVRLRKVSAQADDVERIKSEEALSECDMVWTVTKLRYERLLELKYRFEAGQLSLDDARKDFTNWKRQTIEENIPQEDRGKWFGDVFSADF